MLEEKYTLTIYRNCTNVSIVNKDIRDNPYSKQINDLINKIGKHNIYIIHQSSNHNSISYIMKQDISIEFSQMLHNIIVNKSDSKTLDLQTLNSKTSDFKIEIPKYVTLIKIHGGIIKKMKFLIYFKK